MKKYYDEDEALAVEAAMCPAEFLQHALERALALDPFDESRVRDDFMRAVGRVDNDPPEFGGLLFEYEGRGDPAGDSEVQVTAEVEVWSSALIIDGGLGVQRFVAARWTRASLLPEEVIEEMRLEVGEFKVVRRSV